MRFALLIALPLPILAQQLPDRVAYGEWRKCLLSSAYVSGISTSETADVIARASFGECAQEERAFEKLVNYELLEDISATLRNRLTEEMLAYILRARQGKPSHYPQ